jgi:hypothetical protein
MNIISNLSNLFPPSKTATAPSTRTAAELETAINNLRASLPDLESKQALLALDAAEMADGAEAAYADATAEIDSATSRIRALTSALSAARSREGKANAQKVYDVRKVQTENCQRLLERSEKLAAQLSEKLEGAVKDFRALIDLREKAKLAYPGGNPALFLKLTPPQITALVEAELWRLGGQPFIGGPREPAYPSFPGGVQIDVRKPPAEGQSLADAIREADDYASTEMNKSLAAIKPDNS